MLLVIVKLAWIAVTAFEMPGNFTDRKEHYVIKTDVSDSCSMLSMIRKNA